MIKKTIVLLLVVSMEMQAAAWANSVSKDPERRSTIVHTPASAAIWDDALKDFPIQPRGNTIVSNQISVVVSEPAEYTRLLHVTTRDLERNTRIKQLIGLIACSLVTTVGLMGCAYAYVSHKN